MVETERCITVANMATAWSASIKLETTAKESVDRMLIVTGYICFVRVLSKARIVVKYALFLNRPASVQGLALGSALTVPSRAVKNAR